MNDQQLAARMLGSVGDPNIQPRYVGDPNIVPRYPGGHVGAPLTKVDQYGNPIQYSEQEYLAGNVTWFGLGIVACPAGSIAIHTSTVVDVKPQRPMTPQSFRMPSTTSGLLISQISIAGTNIFAGQAGTPQEFFSEVLSRAATRIPHDRHVHRRADHRPEHHRERDQLHGRLLPALRSVGENLNGPRGRVPRRRARVLRQVRDRSLRPRLGPDGSDLAAASAL